jgi:hypothetical protein
MNLNKDDYITILNYYNIDTNNMKTKQIQSEAEDILAYKLCRCIKKVDKSMDNESHAIAVCKSGVLQRKGLRSFGFKCKIRPKFIPKKGTLKNLVKFRKLNKKRKTRKHKTEKRKSRKHKTEKRKSRK